jgi:hypothetical protein
MKPPHGAVRPAFAQEDNHLDGDQELLDVRGDRRDSWLRAVKDYWRKETGEAVLKAV